MGEIRNVEKWLAHNPAVVAAVRATRDELAAAAAEAFAPHDNPGRHEIFTDDGRVNAVFGLKGPAPLSVELGHFTPDGEKFVEGLHVLTGAVAGTKR